MKIYFWKKFRVKKIGNELSVLNQRTPFWKPFLLILPSLLTVTLMTIIPFMLVIWDSFQVRVGSLARDTSFGFSNFYNSAVGEKGVFNDVRFQIGVRNSFVYSIVSLPISLTISLLISTAITMLVKKWSRGFWQTVFFLPYVTSAIAVSITFFYIFRKDAGFLNVILQKLNLTTDPIPFLESGSPTSWKPFIVILARGIWGSLAFQILILSTAMLSVNPQLYKSASIDGSYKFKQFFAITLPSIKRTISFLITMGLIGGIKVFPLSLFNNNHADAIANGGSSIMLYVYALVKNGQYGTGGAASIMLFVIGVTVSFTLRKFVSLTYIIGTKIGENNVIRKIENKTLKSKPVFKI